MKQRFHQLIYCSEAVGRSFLREILITEVMGQILDNEKMPPHYDVPLERLREQNEFILHLPDNFQINGDTRCPFCGNVNEFYCNCGYISCAPAGVKAHVCPKCQHIFTNLKTCGARISQSGFVHGGEQRIPYYSGKNNRQIESDYKIGDNYRKVSALFDKLLPSTSSPKKNKALPSSDTKKLPWKKD